MAASSIGDTLFSKTQQRVLGLLFGKPDQSFYLNEMVRLANMGKGTIKRELERMTAAGLLTVTTIGNQHHYQANTASPIYHELLGITRKTFGLSDVIRTALVPLDARIDWAFIYGSIAKEQETAQSDIDLMVVSDTLAYADLMAALLEAEAVLGRPINPSIYTTQQFNDRLLANNAFVTRVMQQPKLWIKGSEDGIGKTG